VSRTQEDRIRKGEPRIDRLLEERRGNQWDWKGITPKRFGGLIVRS